MTYDWKVTLKKFVKYVVIFALPMLVDNLIVAYPEWAQLSVGGLLVAFVNWLKVYVGMKIV